MKHARKDYDRIQDPAGLIGEDEPVFLLRAKDVNAPLAVMAWAKEGIRSGVDDVTLKLATDQAARMLQWRKVNRAKLPDVPSNTCPNCGRTFQEGEELRLHNAEPCKWGEMPQTHCQNCFELRTVGTSGLCLSCTGLKLLKFENGVPVSEECYRCHRFGRKDAEFLSPHTGLCALCDAEEKHQKFPDFPGDIILFLTATGVHRISHFSYWYDAKLNKTFAKLQVGTLDRTYEVPGKVSKERLEEILGPKIEADIRKAKEGQHENLDPVDGGPHGLAGPDPAA